MESFGEFLRWVTLGAFAGLSVVSLRLWVRRRDEPALWISLGFMALATALLMSRFVPETGSGIYQFLDKLIIAIILAFPYCLYRVAVSFSPGARVTQSIAGGATAVVFVWALLIPGGADDVEPRPTSYLLFLLAVISLWVFLSVLVAVRFWRGGSGQPPVTRKRMRMLSVAATALSFALIAATAVSGDDAVADAVAYLTAFSSAVMFFLAFSPPAMLRALWRRESEEDTRRAIIDLMTAVTDDAVVDGLLPHVASVVGAEGVAMLDTEGRVIGSYGGESLPWDEIRDGNEKALANDCVQKLDFPFGCLIVKTAPYTSFFGRDEMELLASLGVMTNFALERVRASEMRLELAQAQIRRQQALQINDNVVQGLAVAKYAFDLGETQKAQEAIDGTLAAARRIISDLLEEVSTDEVFGANALTRDAAATGFVNKDA